MNSPGAIRGYFFAWVVPRNRGVAETESGLALQCEVATVTLWAYLNELPAHPVDKPKPPPGVIALMKAYFLLPGLLALGGCATTPPSNPENICAIFREKPEWHDAALNVQKKWGAPVPVPMAMMYQESSYKHDAVPPRYYFLGFIPWGRVSSAYGYAQVKDETWADYKKAAGGWTSSRDNFADALDFMGWYMKRTQQLNGVSMSDAYAQYLNYHEGWTGYRNRSYDRNAWLKTVSQKVQARANKFATQYKSCEKDLTRGGWFF